MVGQGQRAILVKLVSLGILLFYGACAFPAVAAPAEHERSEAESSFEIEGILLVGSDFRFRGVSLSDKGPVLQPEVTISHSSGVYLDFWGSNIAEYNGARTEVDISLGYETELGAASIDIGITASLYPGGTDTDFIELYALAEVNAGPGTIQLQAYYAPSQANIGGADNVYVGIAGRVPVSATSITFHGSFGIEDGAFGDAKRDWMIGASARLLGFDLCVRYVDSARTDHDPLARASAVFLLSRTFVFPKRSVEHTGCPSW